MLLLTTNISINLWFFDSCSSLLLKVDKKRKEIKVDEIYVSLHINYKNAFICYWDVLVTILEGFLFFFSPTEFSPRLAEHQLKLLIPEVADIGVLACQTLETTTENMTMEKSGFDMQNFFLKQGEFWQQFLTTQNSRKSQVVCWLI